MLATILLTTTLSQRPSIQVVVDPRVELLTTVFRLAGAWEYSSPESNSVYGKTVDATFAKFKEHPTVKKADELRKKYGISYDAVTMLAVNITDIDTMGERIPFDQHPKRWDPRWDPKVAREFLGDLKKFAQDTHYAQFFKKEHPYFVGATKSMRSLLDKYDVGGMLQRFYGEGPKHPPTVIIGMLCGGGNYGMSVEYPDGDLEMSPIIGADRFDANANPIYDDNSVSTIVHEFSHPFVNPAMAPYVPRLSPSVDRIMPTLKDVYRVQAYQADDTIVFETMVRATVSHVISKFLSPSVVRNDLLWERSAGFLLTSDLAETLNEYDANRDRYKTFRDFAPVLCAAYEKGTADPAALFNRCPKVVSVEQQWGPVEGNRRQVVAKVTFDKPMLSQRFANWLEGGDYDELAIAKFDPSERVLELKYQVDPTKKFDLCINPEGWGAMSQSGYPVLPNRQPLIPPTK